MSQRKEELKSIDGLTSRDSPRLFKPGLQKTITIKKDLDKHLLMLNVIPTTHKTELRNMVKGKK